MKTFKEWMFNENLSLIQNFAQQNNVELDIYESFDNTIKISRIFVLKELRKQGLGTKILEFICNFADSNNKIILLSPSIDFGATSVNRLYSFYSRFGFIKNKGRKKNYKYTETMIRYPNR
mgnify:CR=1 FL=1